MSTAMLSTATASPHRPVSSDKAGDAPRARHAVRPAADPPDDGLPEAVAGAVGKDAGEEPTARERGALARAVAEAARGVPGVADLVGGPGGQVVTHYPGGTVPGVRLLPDAVVVQVSMDRLPLVQAITETASAVATVLAAAGDHRRVDVVVADLADATLPPDGTR